MSHSTFIDKPQFTILTKDSERAIQPTEVTTNLYPHQLAMIKAAHTLETYDVVSIKKRVGFKKTEFSTKLGVIGYLVGSGKTFITMGILSKPLTLSIGNENMQAYSNAYFTGLVMESSHTPIRGIDVIVVPKSLFSQWKSTIKQHTSYNAVCIENLRQLKDLHQLYAQERNVEIETSYSWDKLVEENRCVLVSCNQFTNMIQNGITKHSKVQIDRLFYDEADTIKMAGFTNQPSFDYISLYTEVKFTWLVSSTVEEIFRPTNYRGEYKKQLFRSLCNIPSIFLQMIMLRNDDKFINESFNIPQPIIETILCKNSRMSNLFNGVVNNDVMNAINAGDITTALSQFGGEQVADDDSLISYVTVKMEEQYENYKTQIERLTHYIDTSTSNSDENLAVYRSRLAQYKTKIISLRERINTISERLSGNDTSCPICLNPEIENKTVLKCCQNSLCFECFTHCLVANTNCPLCRANITSQNDVIIVSGNVADNKEDTEIIQTKELTIKKLISNILKIDNCSSKKILIYSQFSLYNIYNSTKENNISSIILRGTSKQITDRLTHFKKSPSSECLLLNAEHSGAGLNIQEATDIILYHNMSEDMTLQIMGRGQRFGRNGQLRIWRMANEIEAAKLANVDRLLNV